MSELRFSVLASPEEAEAVEKILDAMGQEHDRPSPDELIDQVKREEVGVVILSEDALARLDHAALREAIAEQSTCSDLPVILLVARDRAPDFEDDLEQLGQVRIVERPLDPFLLKRTILTAIRSRQRQGNARALLRKIEEAESRYRSLSESLEARVAQRTRQLESAYDRLIRETQERWSAEERYRLAAYATNDAIWDLDLTTDHIHWAPSSDGLFGHVDVDETTALSWWVDHIHPEDRERVSASLAAAIESGKEHWSENYRFMRADGDFSDIHDEGFIVRDHQGTAIRAVGAMADVTARNRAEAELHRTQSELIHVSRLSAMGAMASALAHEVNQPLTAITNYLRAGRRMLDRDQVGHDDEIRDVMESAEAGAVRAGEIIRRLRDLVTRGDVNMKSENLRTLIDEACVLGFIDGERLRIVHRVEIGPGSEWACIDRIQIQQVLINLIRNALQAMEGQPRRELLIRTAAADEDMVEISVLDRGDGIADDIRDSLFSPFRTTKPDGMGIGLSISRTIVEAHGGHIWAEDRASGGTAFRFTVPKAEPAAPRG